MEHNDFNGAKISEDLTPISKEFDRLERNIHDLELTLTELEEKIKSVLGPEYDSEKGEDPALILTFSSVARLIQNHNKRIEALCRYVGKIRDRVEL